MSSENKTKKKTRKARRTILRDGPHPVDVHVGRRVRDRRIMVGLSQTELGERIGLTFQQIQKYERGTNRISAGKLWAIAQALDEPVSWFFEGLDGAASASEDFRSKRESLQLVRYISSCPAEIRRDLLALMNTMGEASRRVLGEGATAAEAGDD